MLDDFGIAGIGQKGDVAVGNFFEPPMIRPVAYYYQRDLQLVAGFYGQVKAFVRRLTAGSHEAYPVRYLTADLKPIDIDRRVDNIGISAVVALDHSLGVS